LPFFAGRNLLLIRCLSVHHYYKSTTTLVEINPSKTLKNIFLLLSNQENQIPIVVRQCIDAIAWEHEGMKGLHDIGFTHHMYINKDQKLA